MTIETLTIPYVLKDMTESEIIEQIEPHLNGSIISITMIPFMQNGQECNTVIIKYTEHNLNL